MEMNGVHDMGGMHGFGPVDTADDAIFHSEWEKHVAAIRRLVALQGFFNIDAFRYGIERIEPAAYLASTYCERWLASIEHNLIEAGALGSDELDQRVEALQQRSEAEPPRSATVELHPHNAQQEPAKKPAAITPRFAAGDAVMTRNSHPSGHTRLPRYARGKRGVINLVHEPQIFADTNAHGLGENWQAVYNVRFDARELWGGSAEPRQTVSIDLWESYLQAPDESRNEP
jgi:nitrile hydratase